MNTADAKLAFPVLGITADLDLWEFRELKTLTTCGPRTLKNDMQVGMELIDANGRRWVVRSTRRLGRAGALLPWLLSSLVTTPQYRIEHELEALPSVSLAEVKVRVRKGIEAHPDFWSEEDEKRASVLKALCAKVETAKSIASIQRKLELDSFEGY